MICRVSAAASLVFSATRRDTFHPSIDKTVGIIRRRRITTIRPEVHFSVSHPISENWASCSLGIVRSFDEQYMLGGKLRTKNNWSAVRPHSRHQLFSVSVRVIMRMTFSRYVQLPFLPSSRSRRVVRWRPTGLPGPRWTATSWQRC